MWMARFSRRVVCIQEEARIWAGESRPPGVPGPAPHRDQGTVCWGHSETLVGAQGSQWGCLLFALFGLCGSHRVFLLLLLVVWSHLPACCRPCRRETPGLREGLCALPSVSGSWDLGSGVWGLCPGPPRPEPSTWGRFQNQSESTLKTAELIGIWLLFADSGLLGCRGRRRSPRGRGLFPAAAGLREAVLAPHRTGPLKGLYRSLPDVLGKGRAAVGGVGAATLVSRAGSRTAERK